MMTILNRFGTLLREYRKENHMSRDVFAERLGSNPSTIYSYEKGRRTPSIEFLRLMYDVFGVEPNYFFGIRPRADVEKESYSVVKYLEKKLEGYSFLMENRNIHKKLLFADKRFRAWQNDDHDGEVGKMISVVDTTKRGGCRVMFANNIAIDLMGYKIQDLYTTDFEQEDYIEVQVPGNAPININNNMEYGDKKTHWDVMFQMKNVVSVPVEVKYTKSGKSARNQITYIKLPNTVFLFQTLYPHNK